MTGSKLIFKVTRFGRFNRNSVYNLKRRITDLPPISLSIFQSQIDNIDRDKSKGSRPSLPFFQKSCGTCQRHFTDFRSWQTHLKSQHHLRSLSPGSSIATNESSTDTPEKQYIVSLKAQDQFDPTHCLFCNLESHDLEENLMHMSHSHSFFIPDIDFLTDIETFLNYLFSIIAEFTECLFCGSVKATKVAVQDHMRGKGHCRLNFENEEHELHQFYMSDSEEEQDMESDGAVIIGEEEIRLPSGKVLCHRAQARRFRQKHLKEVKDLEITAGSHVSPSENSETETLLAKSTERQLAMRAGTSTSIIGISDLQQRSLRAIEKKTLQTETLIANEYQSVLERGFNQQKRFKVRSIGKKQGGLEKRLG